VYHDDVVQQQLQERVGFWSAFSQSQSYGPLNLEPGAYDGSQAERNVAEQGLLAGLSEFDRRKTSREDSNLRSCVSCGARYCAFSALLRLKSICAPSTHHVLFHSFSSWLPLFELFASRVSHDIDLPRASLAPSPFIESITALVNSPGSHIPRHNVIPLKGIIQLCAQNCHPRDFL
jgi:hypothetical protein